jgi:hypothetical protein
MISCSRSCGTSHRCLLVSSGSLDDAENVSQVSVSSVLVSTTVWGKVQPSRVDTLLHPCFGSTGG